MAKYRKVWFFEKWVFESINGVFENFNDFVVSIVGGNVSSVATLVGFS